MTDAVFFHPTSFNGFKKYIFSLMFVNPSSNMLSELTFHTPIIGKLALLNRMCTRQENLR